VWLGAAAAGVVCLAIGLLFRAVVGDFEGKWEQFVEGFLALTAVAILTWIIFWMRGHARGIASELHRRIDDAIDASALALAFVAVAREGFETVLFLLGAETSSAWAFQQRLVFCSTWEATGSTFPSSSTGQDFC